MAKNVTIAGASYSAVPAIDVPITGGGTARFYDCVGSKTVTKNETVDVIGFAEMIVNVAGGGGGGAYDIKSVTQPDGTQHLDIVDSDASGCTHYIEGGEVVTFMVEDAPYAISIVKGDNAVPEPQKPTVSMGSFAGWEDLAGNLITFPHDPQGDEFLFARIANIGNFAFVESLTMVDTSAFVDLGIKCASDYIVQVDFTPLTITGNCYFGNKTTGDSDDFRLFGVYPSRWFLDYGNSTEGRTSSENGVLTVNTPYRIEFGNRYIKDLDTGAMYAQDTPTAAFEKTHNVLIGNGDRLTFRNIKFIRDGEILANFVPIVHKQTNKCYVYDTVNGVHIECSGNWTYSE